MRELDKAAAAAIALDAPLAEKLALVTRRLATLSPHFATAIGRLIERLESAGAGAQAPKPGTPMPPFRLPDHQHRLVSLADLLDEGPVAIIVVRGHWCHYCRVQVADLAAATGGALRLVFISAETHGPAAALRAEIGEEAIFLCDVGAGYLLSLGLAIWIDPSVARQVKAAGVDVPAYQSNSGWIVPIPAVFVVGQDGLIRLAHVDPDYRRRLDLRAALADLRPPPAAPPPTNPPPAAD